MVSTSARPHVALLALLLIPVNCPPPLQVYAITRAANKTDPTAKLLNLAYALRPSNGVVQWSVRIAGAQDYNGGFEAPPAAVPGKGRGTHTLPGRADRVLLYVSCCVHHVISWMCCTQKSV